MADRTVSVALQLKLAGFTNGLRKAKQDVKDFGDNLAKQARQNKGDLDTVGNTLAGIGVAAGVGLGLAVKGFADFDKAMSSVKAATHETAGNMAELREAALQAGKDTAFSATEAANGIENLAKAGVSTTDILGGGLAGALDLAAAGELGVAEAAETAATAMTQFKLTGDKVPHIADLLAAAAGKAQGEVSDMAQALNQSGLVASQMGLSIEETTGTLAAFASAGLLGSDAGTSFKTMLLALANPSGEAADRMKELGIHAYDAQGAFVGITPLAEQLKTRLAGLSQEQRDSALATIFGSDAIRAASVLYSQGAKGIAEWTTKVDDQGFAAETAAIKTDNLKGDIERLGGSIETALIGAGSGANDMLRGLAQGADDAVSAFAELPGWAQKGSLALAGIATFGGLAGAGLIKGVQAASELREALQTLGGVSARLKFSMGAVGVALAAAVTVFGAFAKENAEAKQRAEELRETLDAQTGAITGNTRAYVANELAQSGLAQKAKDFGLSLSTVTDAALGNQGALEQLVSQLDDIAEANIIANSGVQSGVVRYTEQGEAAKKLRDELTGMNSSLTDAQRTQKLAAEGAQEHKSAQELQTEAVKKANEKIKEETQSLDDLISSMHRASGAALSLSGSQIAYQAAIDNAVESIKEHGRTLDINTEAGRANRTALNQIAEAANDQTDAMLKAGKSNDTVRQTALTARSEFVRVATQMLGNKTKAEQLAKALIDIPEKATTNVTNNADAAKRKAQDYKANGLDKLPKTAPTTVQVKNIHQSKKAVGDFATHVSKTLRGIKDEAIRVNLAYTSSLGQNPRNKNNFATGGPVFGAGTETSDSIPAWLSNNEHVWTAKEVQAAGGHGAVKKMRQSVLHGYATGGEVSLRVDASTPSAMSVALVNNALTAAMAKEIYNAQGGQAAAWARSQAGKPYIWGGVGPRGYDCSGFMSAITNVIMGRNPHQRLFATGGFPTGMFAPGMGRFSIGSIRGNPGHMAGTLGAMNVESRGGDGVVVGPRARGARHPLFGGNVWHLKGYAKGGPVDGDPPFDLLDPRGKEFRKAHNGVKLTSYDDGGMLPTGPSLVWNGTGRPEPVGHDFIRKSELAGMVAQMEITNWETGTGHFRFIAQGEINQNNKQLKRRVGAS